jgi:hypothetical protein
VKLKETSARLAELGRVVRGLERELLERFDGRLRFVRDTGIKAACGILSLKNNLECARWRAVHANRVPSADARSRRKLDEAERIADRARADREIQRQRVELLTSDGRRLSGILRSEKWRRFARVERGCLAARIGGSLSFNYQDRLARAGRRRSAATGRQIV